MSANERQKLKTPSTTTHSCFCDRLECKLYKLYKLHELYKLCILYKLYKLYKLHELYKLCILYKPSTRNTFREI